MRPPTHDLYEVLGVAPSATTAELRRAYRRLALEHHPDRAGPQSAPRFAQIAEAYRMLSDPTARTAYDAHRFERAGRYPQTADDLREDGRGWSVEALRRYVAHVLACFGSERVIWGSDWPVVTLAASYAEWVEAGDELLAGLTQGERDAIYGGNARRFYGLD